MLRIGSMNLMLHGLTAPRFHYADTLSKAFTEESRYDVVLANHRSKAQSTQATLIRHSRLR